MCWSQQLFDAMIHVYNRGLSDFTTPLLELLLQLRAVVKRGKTIPGAQRMYTQQWLAIVVTLSGLIACAW